MHFSLPETAPLFLFPLPKYQDQGLTECVECMLGDEEPCRRTEKGHVQKLPTGVWSRGTGHLLPDTQQTRERSCHMFGAIELLGLAGV